MFERSAPNAPLSISGKAYRFHWCNKIGNPRLEKKPMKVLCLLLACCIIIVSPVSRVDANAWKQNNLLITFWSPPPTTNERLSVLAKEGFNLTWAPSSGLENVRKHGLKAIIQDDLLTPSTLDNPEKRDQLDRLIDWAKNHPSLEAYYVADEPNAADFSGLGRLVSYLRERDPSHFAYINLYPVYATNKQLGTSGTPVQAYQEYLRRFIDEVKPSLISYDHYHFLKSGDDDKYFLNLELIRQASLKSGLPFLNTIQASTILETWRLVSANELRWLVYTTLVYGGRGISYFLYWGPRAYGGLYQDGVRTPLVDTVTVLNKEIAAQSIPLMELNSLGTYHTGPLPTGAKPVPASSPVRFVGEGNFILGLFGKGNSITTFMVVNRNYKIPATAQLVLKPEARSIEEFDRTSKQWKAYQALNAEHGISVMLSPGDGKLFRFVP
jgi:hypothetical protein